MDIAIVEQAARNGGGENDPTLCAGNPRPKPLPGQVRRNVILMIGDGMQLGDEIAISRYLHGTDNGLIRHSFPYQGYVTTWDVTTYNKYAAIAGKTLYCPTDYDPSIGYDPAQAGALPYPLEDNPLLYSYLSRITASSNGWWAATDSASAATAMSTGQKTDDGNIAWLSGDPVGGALPTVGEAVRSARGMSFGVVSTQAFTAGTPAAFSGHHPDRYQYPAIGDSVIYEVEPDVVIGGGYPKFSNPPKFTFISKGTYEALANSATEYLFVERAANADGGSNLLTAADRAVEEEKKLFGLFGTTRSNGIFEIGMPLNDLGHPNVTPGSSENPTLAQASLAALKVLSQNPAGFFLMIEQGDIDTANHANNFQQMLACGVDLERATEQVIQFVEQPGDDISWDNTVLMIVADHTTGYMRLRNDPDKTLGQGELPVQNGTSYPGGEVSYRTGGHSNELVHLSIIGSMAGALSACEGREYPGTRILNNTVLHSFMLRAAGL